MPPQMPRRLLRHVPVTAIVVTAAASLVPNAQAADALTLHPQATPTTSARAAYAPDIDVAAVEADLARLQQIATANGGDRSTGRPGLKASVDAVKAKLDAAGFVTVVQAFPTALGTSYNLIADLPGGSANSVVMVGSHIDSVRAGAGINDNGTGTAATLETALAYAKSGQRPANHLRFAWWGSEEQGLLGSTHYVNSLSSADVGRIKAYLNVDMIGSVNPGYFVYDDNPAGNALRDDLTRYYDSKNIRWEYIDPQGRSDHAQFRARGIPTAGIYSGGEVLKTAAQARTWGGTAGKAFDPCYHRSCDSLANIDRVALDRHTDAMAAFVWKYAAAPLATARTNPPVAARRAA